MGSECHTRLRFKGPSGYDKAKLIAALNKEISANKLNGRSACLSETKAGEFRRYIESAVDERDGNNEVKFHCGDILHQKAKEYEAEVTLLKNQIPSYCRNLTVYSQTSAVSNCVAHGTRFCRSALMIRDSISGALPSETDPQLTSVYIKNKELIEIIPAVSNPNVKP